MDSFEKFLITNCDKYMCVITPGGNHGDNLIHMGLMKKLSEYTIKNTCLNLEKLYKDKPLLGAKYITNIGLWKLGSDLGFNLIRLPKGTELILFEGGGYMSDIWYGPTLLKQIMKRNPLPIAIGPQSYLFTKTRFHIYFKDGLPVDLFCREKYSFEHLKKKGLPDNVSIHLSPDLALYLTYDDLIDLIEERSGGYTLINFRKDRESVITQSKKQEIIQKVTNPMIADISMENTIKDFVSTVYNANTVYTDRLHVAILSKILRKKVILYGNKYHKNRGVWEYSLQDSVEYVETL